MLVLKEMKGLLASSLTAALLVGCGGGGDKAAAPAEGGSAPAAAAAPAANPVDAATAGNIKGTVKFTGTAPAPVKIDMKEEPACATANPNPVKEDVVTSNGALANVFV